MYHCHLQLYLVGPSCRAFDLIRQTQPLERFTHELLRSDTPERDLAAKADAIFANLQDADEKAVLKALLAGKGPDSQLILLAGPSQAEALADRLAAVTDLWPLPMSDDLLRFRFARWQRLCQREKDAWQTSQFLEVTINSIPSLVWYKTKDGIHEKVNDSFCKTVNKPKSLVEGRDHCFIWGVGPEEREVCDISDRAVMTSGKTCVSEEDVASSEGRRVLTAYKSALYDVDGSVMGTVGVGIDVTRERAYEKELIEKNRSLESIFTALECGVLCHSLDGTRVISVNNAALKILGYRSKNDLVADGFQGVAGSVLDEDKPKLRACIQSLTKKGDSANVEYRVLHEDGSIVHVMGNVKVLEENGELFYQRFLLDVTAERLQEEAQHRHQAELLQALSIDYSLVCFLDLDTDLGTPLRRHQIADDIFPAGENGTFHFQDSMERYIHTYVYPDDRDLLRQAVSRERLEEALAEENQFYVPYRRLVDGQPNFYEMKAVRSGSWDENRGVVLGFHSVDEATRRDLEKRQALEDALVQANHANNAKSTFLSNMSHDIRTPMNAILGFASLALSHLDDREKVAEYLQKIKSSGGHMLNLVNDVLDMSWIESGKMQLEEQPCALADILRDLTAIVQNDVREKELDLKLDTAGVSDQDIFCDKLRLSQVLLNVLSNAVKYTEPGGSIRLRVRELPGAPDGFANYEFRIKDTGIGISRDFLSHIFDPFEREKNSTISGIEGTGLGMAITKNLVDLMHGTISVESALGVGTEVTLLCTFRRDAPRPAAAPEETAAPAPRPAGPRSGRILLAEDNALNREIAQVILEEAGFTVEWAENGQVAVDMVARSAPGHFQLVLMDVQMPVMNGYDAARAIRALDDKALASIPILAMTANAFETDRQEALRSGMNDHIPKPIDIGKLLATLDRILAGS